MASLDALAGITRLNVLSYIVIHSRPIEHSVDSGIGAFDALVSSDGGVMMIVEDLGSEFSSRNAQPVLVIVKVAFLIYGVMSEERGWAHLVGWEVLKVLEDVFEVWVLGDGVFDLDLEIVDYLKN